MSACVNLPLHHKVQKFSSGTGSSGGPGKGAVKWLWCVWWWCILIHNTFLRKRFAWFTENCDIARSNHSTIDIDDDIIFLRAF